MNSQTFRNSLEVKEQNSSKCKRNMATRMKRIKRRSWSSLTLKKLTLRLLKRRKDNKRIASTMIIRKRKRRSLSRNKNLNNKRRRSRKRKKSRKRKIAILKKKMKRFRRKLQTKLKC